MRTKFFFILFILPLSTIVKSQYGGVKFEPVDRYTEIDTARYVITYTFDAILDTTKTEKKTDQLCLEIGSHLSKVYSLRAYKADSIATDLMIKRIDNIVRTPAEPMPDIIYKNYPSGKLTFISRTVGGVLRYEEDYPIVIKWKLIPEKKDFLGYTCQKAEAVFRGRMYTAWFTPEIPLKEGPGKFGGLPGLILQLSDSQDHFNYTCVGIEKSKTIIPITYWPWKSTEMSRKKYLDTMKKMHKTPLKYSRAVGGGLFYVGDNGKVTPGKNTPQPYNPMERE